MKVVTEVREGSFQGFFFGCFSHPDPLLERLQSEQGHGSLSFLRDRGDHRTKRQKMFILGVAQTSRDPAKRGVQGICKADDLALPGSR